MNATTTWSVCELKIAKDYRIKKTHIYGYRTLTNKIYCAAEVRGKKKTYK